jgi:RNA polymerase sigma-70 factor, ECF subfamily
VGLAIHLYHDAQGMFPTGGGTTQFGGLWNVEWSGLILPFVERGAVAAQIDYTHAYDRIENQTVIWPAAHTGRGPSRPTRRRWRLWFPQRLAGPNPRGSVNYYRRYALIEPRGERPVSALRADDEFVRRFVRCQQDLYAYILTLVPNIADAQDILQETSLALWSKADEYRLGEPFMPWAARFAWFQVRKFRMYQARRGRRVVALSDDAIAALAADREKFEELAADRAPVLQQCVEKLADDDRLLLRQRYDLRVSIREVAQRRGVEPGYLYKRLRQIRQALLDCVDRAFEERSE